MAIHQLSAETARLLGSTLNIASPCQLVKELLDNALDAGASSIQVQVSPNCLDKIRVSDNGLGIAATDFDRLAAPSHTSKLSSFEDLPQLATQQLGFRGLALASITNVATVEVVTRTKHDPVATKLKIRQGVGGAESKSPVSAPIGTSVVISGIFGNLPARKQYQLKQIPQTQTKIKELIKTYSLARHSVQFSIKVLGEQSFWKSAPPGAGLRESVAAAVSCDVAKACRETVYTCPVMGESLYTLHGMLPENSKNVSKKGRYISIDGRPLVTNRGFGKRLYSTFKEQFPVRVAKPFMCLRITSTNAAYDVNVSTSKDEVIIREEEDLNLGFKRLCERVYTSASYCEMPEVALPSTEMVSIQARSVFGVNMERSNSNETEIDDADYEDVQILAQLMALPAPEPAPTLPPRRKGIEAYFKAQNQDFDIYVDDTATPLISSPVSSDDPPVLRPTTASAVNSLQEESFGSDEDSSGLREEAFGSDEDSRVGTPTRLEQLAGVLHTVAPPPRDRSVLDTPPAGRWNPSPRSPSPRLSIELQSPAATERPTGLGIRMGTRRAKIQSPTVPRPHRPIRAATPRLRRARPVYTPPRSAGARPLTNSFQTARQRLQDTRDVRTPRMESLHAREPTPMPSPVAAADVPPRTSNPRMAQIMLMRSPSPEDEVPSSRASSVIFQDMSELSDEGPGTYRFWQTPSLLCHEVPLVIRPGTEDVVACLEQLISYDDYVRAGKLTRGLPLVGVDAVEAVERRLNRLIR